VRIRQVNEAVAATIARQLSPKVERLLAEWRGQGVFPDDGNKLGRRHR
jgi:hypothetical protein